MRFGVVPARNEQETISNVINTLAQAAVDHIVVVANGCRDQTVRYALEAGFPSTTVLDFPESLGVDVPRAVGAYYALEQQAQAVVFMDGDMKGPLAEEISALLRAVQGEVDLALTNCYPYIQERTPLSGITLGFRSRLNRALGFYNELGLAIASHGPHAVSRRLLTTVPLAAFSVPPLLSAYSFIHRLNIKVAVAVPHNHLHSALKGPDHACKMAATIIGDCLEAIYLVQGLPRHRTWMGQKYIGYHAQRRFDVLEDIVRGKRSLSPVRS